MTGRLARVHAHVCPECVGRLAPSTYGVPVTIDPGLPVALAVVLLLTLTVTMYLVGRLLQPGSTLFSAGAEQTASSRYESASTE